MTLKELDIKIDTLLKEYNKVSNKEVMKQIMSEINMYANLRNSYVIKHPEYHQSINPPLLTRVEVITNKGREFVKYTKGNFEFFIQDDGRTLKIFEESKN